MAKTPAQTDKKPLGTALVTGASKRIGRAIARRLAEAGFDLALHYHHSEAECQSLAQEITQLGRNCLCLAADLVDEASVRELFRAAHVQLSPVTLLVNNAALFERDEWNSVTHDSWHRHMAINLYAPFCLMQEMARNLSRHLPPERTGLIVNMIDQRVWNLTPHFVSYSVSKYGLWGLTQSLALAFAPQIRVNAIGPGPTLPSPNQSDAHFTHQQASLPLRHGASPEEIAEAVMFLWHSSSMTGQMLALDGGQHLNWRGEQKNP
ncbi:MAG: SDR family oxidoreductase [Alphaproteobacteria bacterium]|nr:SDR family oxidoreductase [Alphaproteobacteria bacterium]